MKNSRQWISWILLFLWVVVIFHFSSQVSDVSTDLSRGITYRIIDFFESHMSVESLEITYSTLHFLVRKSAHFFEFAVLGMISVTAFRWFRRVKKHSWLCAWLFCTMVAGIDETVQLFVDGRDAAVRDVFIDSAGALLGITVMSLVLMLFQGRSKKIVEIENTHSEVG